MEGDRGRGNRGGREGRGGRGYGRNNGGRGRGGRSNTRNFQNAPNNPTEVKLNAPNINKGTLSNFPEWKEFIYKKSKDITKHLHRMVLTDVMPSDLQIINRNMIVQVFGALPLNVRQEIINANVIDEDQAADIAIMPNNAESKRYRKQFDEARWEIWKELDEDKPKMFNLVFNSLSRVSEELIKGNLGEDFDIIRTESDVQALWNCIINSHNNGENLNPVDMNQIRQNYYTVKMAQNESLSSFHQRFEALEHNMRRIDPHFNPNTDANYILFVEALDNKRYGEFKTAFMNDVTKPIELRSLMPRFRGNLFELINNYVTTNKYSNNNNYSDKHRSAYSVKKDSKQNAKDENQPGNKSDNKNEKAFVPWKGYKGCNICGSRDHLERNCTLSRDDAKKIISNYLNENSQSKELKKIELYCRALSKSSEDISSICLDTMSQINIFNNKCPYLQNHHRTKDRIILRGIGNDKVYTNSMATFKDIEVYTSPCVNANILSFSLLNKMKRIKFDHINNEFIVNIGDDIMIFREHDDLYKCYEIYSIISNSLTKEELNKVEVIKNLYDKLAFPGDKTVEDMIKKNKIKGLYVNLEDFKNYKRVYPKRVEAIRGKCTRVRNSYIPITNDQRHEMIKSRKIDLAIDLFYISGYVFIIGVNVAFDLTMVRLLRDRTREEIFKALNEMIETYAVNGWIVNNIYSDEEKGVIACAEDLRSKGVTIKYVAPGSHVAIAERKIRTIKDRARSLLQTIKYRVPISLLPHLILYTVTRINQTPTIHTPSSSPREIFNGDVLDFEKDLRLNFGQIVEIINPVQRNDMQPRSEPAIYIGPSNYNTNSHFFFTKNGSVVLRQDFVITNNSMSSEFDIKSDGSINPDELENENVNVNFVNDDINLSNDENVMENRELLDHVSNVNDDNNDKIEETNEDEESQQLNDTNDYEKVEKFVPNFNEGIYFETNDDIITDNNINDVNEDSSTTSDEQEYDVNSDEYDNTQHTINYTHDIEHDIDDMPRYWRAVNKIEIHDEENDINPNLYKEAIITELTNMKSNDVWESIPNDVNVKVISSKIFVKTKRNSNGDVIKVKARLTAGGHLQHDIGVSESYSPTSSINSIMMMTTIHANRGSKFTTMDITAAYLNATISDDIYMRIDADIVDYMKEIDMVNEEHIRPNGSLIVKLKRALYGTKQAGRAWFQKLNDDIKTIGYCANDVELGIYSRDIDNNVFNIAIYVDDIIIMASDEYEHNRVVNEFKKLYENITVSTTYDNVFEYLGLTFKIQERNVYLSMTGYTNKILSEREDLKMIQTPYNQNLFMNRDINLLPNEDQTKLRSSCAKLLYLAKRVRPDILLPVIVLSSRINKYNVDDIGKLNRIYNYLYMTKDYELKLCDNSNGKDVTLNLYVDASYGIYPDGKGQTAYGFTLGHGMFYVKSNKQKSVGRSSTGAEIIAIDEAACEAVHLKNLINTIGFRCNECVMYEDNMAAIKIIEGGIETMNKTKFMRVRMANVKEIINENGVKLKHCPTERMIVDILTKPIGGKRFKVLRDEMLGHG